MFIFSLYQEGFFALYRGLVASLLGIPHVIIQFNLYEHLKDYGAKHYNKSKEDLPLRYIFFTSIISKSKNYFSINFFIVLILYLNFSVCLFLHLPA